MIAALAAIVLMAILYLAMGFGGFQAFFVALIFGLIVGFVLSRFLCSEQTASSDLAAEEKPAQRYAREAAEDKARRAGEGAGAATDAASHADAPSIAADTTAAEAPQPGSVQPASLISSSAVKPSQPLPGQQELASRKGEWTYQAGGAETAPAAAAKKKAKTAPVASERVAEAEPQTLYTSPPAEGADDLKLISGVGPKLEQTLNELGIYRFAQVAEWGPSDIAWVDNRVRFKGRIERDDWMSQAKILAEGGETEFSARKKK